jgi:hypothetical protein
MDPRAGLDGCGKSRPHCYSIPGTPSPSESLCRLRLQIRGGYRLTNTGVVWSTVSTVIGHLNNNSKALLRAVLACAGTDGQVPLTNESYQAPPSI